MHAISPTDFLKKAHDTAHHFGFLHLSHLTAPQSSAFRAERAGATERKYDALGGALVYGVAEYLERALHGEHPSFFYTSYEMPRTKEIAFNFQIVGVKKSIAEALLIQMLRSFARDLGYEHYTVRINSLGDHDSMNRYIRELTAYFRKRLEDMPDDARELMKESVVSALQRLIELDHELGARSPSPLEYLSDASRKHFREIIEHLDMTETPYEIDARLLGHHQCYSDALFSMDLRNADESIEHESPFTIRGGRLDAFARRVLKVDVPATGAVVILHRKAPARIPKARMPGTPPLFLVQLGFGPKIRSLILLENFKRAGIRARQALVSDSLGEQLREAETLGIPYSLILGQKEYVENSIILRDMRSRSQEQIPLGDLIPRLKRVLRST